MFGYVNILKEDLKVGEYYTFRSYYCGLCRSIGSSCSQLARLGLSYDMTFLAILLDSLNVNSPKFENKSCIAHPFNKRRSVTENSCVNYAADMSVILIYKKLLDDWHDDLSVKALFSMIGYRRAYKKLQKKYPTLCEHTEQCLDELALLEKAKSNDIDKLADCFARITKEFFSPDFEIDSKRQLQWLGYNIGRWIYIIDAYDDIDKDYKDKKYNPFLVDYNGENLGEYKKNLANRLDITLTYTLDNASSGYDLLNVYKNDAILKNILHLGLKVRQNRVLNKGRENIESI